MSAKPSPLTSATSRPVLDSVLVKKPFVPNAIVEAGNVNAPAFVNDPPSGFFTITGTEPLPSEGFGTVELNRIVDELMKVAVRSVCVGPGLKMICAFGWKLDPVTV